MYAKQEFNKIIIAAQPKDAKKMQIPIILRLIEKLEEKGIDDGELNDMFEALAQSASSAARGGSKDMRAYKKQSYEITSYVQKEYEMVAKGYYTGIYMTIGIAMGAALGSILSTAIGPAYLALGIGPGLAIGLAYGAHMDKKAEKEGRGY